MGDRAAEGSRTLLYRGRIVRSGAVSDSDFASMSALAMTRCSKLVHTNGHCNNDQRHYNS